MPPPLMNGPEPTTNVTATFCVWPPAVTASWQVNTPALNPVAFAVRVSVAGAVPVVGLTVRNVVAAEGQVTAVVKAKVPVPVLVMVMVDVVVAPTAACTVT